MKPKSIVFVLLVAPLAMLDKQKGYYYGTVTGSW